MRSKENSLSVSALASMVEGSIIGSSTMSISGVCTLESPQPGRITFIRTKSSEFVARELERLPAMAVLVPRNALPENLPPLAATVIAVKDSYAAFLDIVPQFFESTRPAAGIHPSAVVAPGVKLGADVSIGAYCTIEPGCTIGDRTVLHSHVRIYRDVILGSDVELFSGVSIRAACKIGSRVTIHDNTVIGADGFGYIPDAKIGMRKVPQLGDVVIGDDVEIGASTCIDRATFGSTSIGRGTKIDNLVQIGHNTTIGAHCCICGHAAIAGSCTIGDGVVFGGSSGLADHLEIVSGVRVGGWCGVISSLSEPGDYMGYPAMRAYEFRRQQVTLRRLVRERKHKD